MNWDQIFSETIFFYSKLWKFVLMFVIAFFITRDQKYVDTKVKKKRFIIGVIASVVISITINLEFNPISNSFDFSIDNCLIDLLIILPAAALGIAFEID